MYQSKRRASFCDNCMHPEGRVWSGRLGKTWLFGLGDTISHTPQALHSGPTHAEWVAWRRRHRQHAEWM